MDNIIFLILYISILILIVKYIKDLKSDKTLVVVLALLGLACLGYIFQTPFFIIIGLIPGTIIAPILFSIYLIRKLGSGKDRTTRILMLIPTLTLFFTNLPKLLHLAGFGFTAFFEIISLVIGGYLILYRRQLKEVKPFQVILIIIAIDVLIFLMN